MMRNRLIQLYRNYDIVHEYYIKLKTQLFYRFLFGRVGKKTSIFKPIRLINPHNIYLGNNVRVYKHSRIETVEKWGVKVFNPRIQIGDFTTFEQRLHLTCASNIRIGVGVTVLSDVVITDIKHSYDDVNVRSINQTIQTFDTIIEDYCFIGAGAKILPGTELGTNCIVGANSVVVGKFPSYSVIAGNPARIIKKYNHVTKKWDNKVEF